MIKTLTKNTALTPSTVEVRLKAEGWMERQILEQWVPRIGQECERVWLIGKWIVDRTHGRGRIVGFEGDRVGVDFPAGRVMMHVEDLDIQEARWQEAE